MTDRSTQTNQLYFNGINGTTGEYSLSPLSLDQFVTDIMKQPLPSADKDAKSYYETYIEFGDYAPADDGNPKLLAEVGWGVIFASDEDPAVIEALQPLLTHRRQQAGEHYYEYKGEFGDRRGYITGESKVAFLRSRGVEPYGPADAVEAPYYLLIVGPPTRIPFDFQYELDVQYAVGRIHFDTPEEYAQYAQNVVQAETSNLELPRKATFFGVEHDGATRLSANHLVAPLILEMEKLINKQDLGWSCDGLLKAEATKDALTSLINSGAPPSLLFTASHGVEFEPHDPRLQEFQGALLCPNDPEGRFDFKDEINYFAASDIASTTNLLGMMAFHFACYSAGTPQENNFIIGKDRRRPGEIAPNAFMAQLPQKLLLNGALAVIGHIDRAWGHSITAAPENLGDGGNLAAYRSTLRRLMDGHPVGSATEFIDQKYGEYSTALTWGIERRDMQSSNALSDHELARLWTANNDMRNYVIVGDPAARLPVVDAGDVGTDARPAPISVTSGFSSRGSTDMLSSQPHEDERESTATEIQDQNLHDFSARASNLLAEVLDDGLRQDILTYASGSDLSQAYDTDTQQFSDQAVLKAVTRISHSGDVSQIVPMMEQTGELSDSQATVDQGLWHVHQGMVKLAQAHKIELLKVMAELIKM